MRVGCTESDYRYCSGYRGLQGVSECIVIFTLALAMVELQAIMRVLIEGTVDMSIAMPVVISAYRNTHIQGSGCCLERAELRRNVKF